MHSHLKGAFVAFGLLLGSAGVAQAAPQNFSPCLDVAGQGFGGLACTVAGGDTFNFGPGDSFTVHTSGNDHEGTVEAALRWVFGESIDLFDGVHGLEGDQAGFDFDPNDITSDDSFTVTLDQGYTFATVKAATYFIIFDIRGLTEVTLGTDGFIHNMSGPPHNPQIGDPIEVSHVSFWNATFDPGPDPNEVPAPGALGLLGLGLIGLGLARRRKA